MAEYDTFSNHRRKRLACEHVYRIGPAPRDEVDLTKDRKEGPKVKECAEEIGSLDGNLEIMQNESQSSKIKFSAPSRTLLIYFAKMAKKSNKDTVDYYFLSTLINSGAHINVSDKHGQTVMHEVARNWSIDVAKFFIINGVDVNKADEWGRTPLHLAAAVNHCEMVEYLLQCGGNAMARTKGEMQTPIHYAAKYNAVSSLKVLIDNRVDYNCRDYKERTPIFLAAEMAQEDSARYLLDLGVPVGVFDDTGMSAIGLMIERMPHIAVDGLNQFQTLDAAFRKESFYLNYLEEDPKSFRLQEKESNGDVDIMESSSDKDKFIKKEIKRTKRLACPTTALEIAVNHFEDNVIMHPVMQQLIRTKWNLFGRVGASIEFMIHLIFCIVWTALGIFLPRDGDYYETGLYWRVPAEAFGVFITFFFILKQIWESKISFNEAKKFRLWRIRQINRDLAYCHPRWSQEKIFLEHEMKNLNPPSSRLLQDPWNVMEFVTYVSVLVAIVTRIIHVLHDNNMHNFVHARAYSVSLIFLWIHFMKSCRAFTTLGLFIAMLGYAVKETIIFAFICFEIFIPYMVGFWILFGGIEHAETMKERGEDPVDWKVFNNLMFSVWQITLVADFNLDAILSVDKIVAQVMVGTFYAFCSLVCINLHIAFLAETFSHVYMNAKAHTSRLQAITVLHVEKILSKNRLMKVHEHFQTYCAPLVIPSGVDTSHPGKELSLRTIRAVLARLNICKEFILNRFLNNRSQNSTANNIQYQMNKKYKEEKEIYDLYQGVISRDKVLYDLRLDIYELKCAIIQLVDGKHPIPPKPKYIPLPMLDMQLPSKPSILEVETTKQKERENQRVFSKNQTRRDNEMFQCIMRKQSTTAYEDKERCAKENIIDNSEEDSDFETVEVDNLTYRQEESKHNDREDSCILA